MSNVLRWLTELLPGFTVPARFIPEASNIKSWDKILVTSKYPVFPAVKRFDSVERG